jgi:hypothetical protein
MMLKIAEVTFAFSAELGLGCPGLTMAFSVASENDFEVKKASPAIGYRRVQNHKQRYTYQYQPDLNPMSMIQQPQTSS